jgi:hypothetical protein
VRGNGPPSAGGDNLPWHGMVQGMAARRGALGHHQARRRPNGLPRCGVIRTFQRKRKRGLRKFSGFFPFPFEGLRKNLETKGIGAIYGS